MSKDKKTVGIIGGMGPGATALLFQKLIQNVHCSHGDGNDSTVIGFGDFTRNTDGGIGNPGGFHLDDFTDSHPGKTGENEGCDDSLTLQYGLFIFVPECGLFQSINFILGSDSFPMIFKDFALKTESRRFD